jgi:hypothetical protein
VDSDSLSIKLTHTYYNIRLKAERHRIYANDRLKEIINKMDENSKSTLQANKQNLETSLNTAIREHNIICKDNAKDRSEYLEQFIEDLRERNNSEHVTIKQILHRENSKNDFRTIKQILKPSTSKGVNHLDIPVKEHPDTWIRITDQHEIEELIL